MSKSKNKFLDDKIKLEELKRDLLLLSNGIDPQSNIKITQDTILLSLYNKKLFNETCIQLASATGLI